MWAEWVAAVNLVAAFEDHGGMRFLAMVSPSEPWLGGFWRGDSGSVIYPSLGSRDSIMHVWPWAPHRMEESCSVPVCCELSVFAPHSCGDCLMLTSPWSACDPCYRYHCAHVLIRTSSSVTLPTASKASHWLMSTVLQERHDFFAYVGSFETRPLLHTASM